MHFAHTPWCRVLLEKLTGLQLVKKFPGFHGTQKFITALTSVRHLSLSWARPIQSIYPHPASRRSVLILSTHLRLCLSSGLLPSGFPTKTLYTPLSSPIRATCPAHLIPLVAHGTCKIKLNLMWLDGPGIESRWERDFPIPSRPKLGTTRPPIQWVLGSFSER